MAKQTHPQHTLAENEDMLVLDNKVLRIAKHFRMHLVNKLFSEPCCVNFWKNKLNIQLTKWHWNIVRSVCKESRLRELHWKILHNVYPTNIILNKIGIAQTNKCSYCVDKVDYIEHFFVECPKINKIWCFVEDTINVKLNIRIKLTVSEMLVGCSRKEGMMTQDIRYINFLIIIAKMCISKYRYGTPLDIIHTFEKELRLRTST
jgi:uncharacterized pyridoxal phosphate-containing UPF0001 family protein